MLRDRILADLVVALHAAFVGFVVLGMAAIVVGLFRHWRWVRNFWIRIAHLAAIIVVVVLTLAGEPCPLTTWEMSLREGAGQATYPGGFVAHWLHELIFFQAPEWVFAVIYSVFGLVVLAVFVLGPPHWPRFHVPRSPPRAHARPRAVGCPTAKQPKIS